MPRAQNLYGSAFNIFLLRQFFLGIPRELFEAARVDAASCLRMFRAIALSGEYHWEIATAATLIATAPMVIIVAFTQRYVLDGIATSAKQG